MKLICKTALTLILAAAALFAEEEAKPQRRFVLALHPFEIRHGVTVETEFRYSKKGSLKLRYDANMWDLQMRNWGDATGGEVSLYFPIYLLKASWHRPMNAPYVAPFGKYLWGRYQEENITVTTSDAFTAKYDRDFSWESFGQYDLEAVKIGVVGGRRFLFFKNQRMTVDTYIGYGIFPYYKAEWDLPDERVTLGDTDIAESNMRLLQGWEWGVSLGIAF